MSEEWFEDHFRATFCLPENGWKIIFTLIRNKGWPLVEQTHFCWVKSLMGVKFPPVSTPLPLDSEKKREWRQKGCLNQLKIEQWVAYRLIIIATQGFRVRQNSCGFRAIRDWVTILADFQKRGIYKGIGFEAKLTLAVFFLIDKRSPNFYFFTRL